MEMKRTLGAILANNGHCHFRVWAPFVRDMRLEIIPLNAPTYQLSMIPEPEGYFSLSVKNIQVGYQYYYCFSNKKYPDLASDFQPMGINGPSQIMDKTPYQYWNATNLSDYIIYELHVGTYTTEGTFTAIIPYLDELSDLGITAIELMPIAQFSGARNWGYDGVLPFAVQQSYGGPSGLKDFINACHQRDMSVILDVVYNHIGPEGNFFNQFGPYFTNKYHSPWGESLNFDDQYNHHVRRYFIENALHWFTEYGVDALRLDAVHAIIDTSAYSFLQELSCHVNQLATRMNRHFYLIAESNANDLHLIQPRGQGGCGMHAQWNDDFHHALHALLTHDHHGYYQDFGGLEQLIKAYKEGFVYSGEYSSFRNMPYGVSSKQLPAEKLVVFMQNHDQIGNRLNGDRLTRTLSLAQIRLAIGLMLCSPYIPLIFMGEEYGETAPFLYFISHQNEALIQSVRKGRCREFALDETDVPDPQALDTFLNSKLCHSLKFKKNHTNLWNYYKTLIAIRKEMNGFYGLKQKETCSYVIEDNNALEIQGSSGKNSFTILANFTNQLIDYSSNFTPNGWNLLINSAEKKWAGVANNNKKISKLLSPYGFMLYQKDRLL